MQTVRDQIGSASKAAGGTASGGQ